ncbi:hypothetical protein NYO67_4565 [Aspergillus flavus]|nr:hypothetical protein NYO67_4565 [Aspergillus flavus]
MLMPPVQMSLLQLPLELLHMIGAYLDQPALSALCRTCRATHGHFQPVIFKYNVEYKKASGLFWAVVHHRPDIATVFLENYSADINGKYLGEPLIFHIIRHWPAETAEHFLKYPQMDVDVCARSGENLLWFAVHQQRLSIVRELLLRPDIVLSSRDQHDHTLLSFAIWQGDMSLFQLLLANPRVPVNQGARMGASPLYWAIYKEQYDMAERLVQDERVDVNGVNTPSWSTPIVYASRRRLSNFLALLLQNPRIDLSRTDETGCTALWHALNNSDNPSIDLLLGHTQHIQDCFHSVTGETLCELAIVKGCETVVKLLLEQDRKANSDARRSDWFHAARNGQVGIVRLFLDSGVDINAADDNGDTALHHAVRHGNDSVVTCLLHDERTNVNRRNQWAGTALHVAVQNLCYLYVARPDFSGDTEANFQCSKEGSPSLAQKYTQYIYIISLLLEGGTNSNAADCTGRTALHILATSTFPEAVQLLLARHGVDVNAVDDRGRTPLAWASETGSLSVAKLLLQHSGVRLNARHHGEYTPLWLACRAGRVHMVEILLQQDGIDVHHECGTGTSPLHVSITAGHSPVVELLLTEEDRVDVNRRSLGQGLTPLMLAASLGREGIVQCLLRHPSIDVNAVDASGRTALFWAASGGHHDSVRLLLGHPALRTRRRKDNQGYTAYAVAKKRGHASVIFLFRAP